MELDQLFGGPVTFRIFDAHALDKSFAKKWLKPLKSQWVSPGIGHCTGGGEGDASGAIVYFRFSETAADRRKLRFHLPAQLGPFP
jgi:hypothetical protein